MCGGGSRGGMPVWAAKVVLSWLEGNLRGCGGNERPEEEAWVVERQTENLRLAGARCSEPDAVAGFADELQCVVVRQLAQVTGVVL